MPAVYHFPWEINLIVWIQDLMRSYPFLVSLFSTITQLGEPFFAAFFVTFLYFGSDKKQGMYVATSVIGAQIVNSMVKNIFLRVRPYLAEEQVECFLAVDGQYDINDLTKQGYSFPSGHCTNLSSLFASMYLWTKEKRAAIFGYILVILVAISRFALGVHYPTDVFTGIILGTLFALFHHYLYLRLPKKKLYLVIVALCALGLIHCDSNDYYSTFGLLVGFMLGDLYEEKYVNFNSTNNQLRTTFRMLGGTIILLGVSSLLKLPFSEEVLESLTLFAFLYRTFRYALAAFITVGIFPKLFKYNIFQFKD